MLHRDQADCAVLYCTMLWCTVISCAVLFCVELFALFNDRQKHTQHTKYYITIQSNTAHTQYNTQHTQRIAISNITQVNCHYCSIHYTTRSKIQNPRSKISCRTKIPINRRYLLTQDPGIKSKNSTDPPCCVCCVVCAISSDLI
jgi:hypothetical protein